MSQNIPPRKQRARKPDYKIRPGFSQEEFEDWRSFLVAHGYNSGPGVGSFTRKALLAAIGKTPADIEEGELSS